MPPPKNGKAAALVAANSAGAAPVLPIGPLPGSDVNKRIYEGVTDDLSTIRSKFKHIETADPPAISEGAFVEPFKLPDYKKAMHDHGRYGPVGCNLLWLDAMYVPLVGVPVDKVRLGEYTSAKYADPIPLDKPFIIAVPSLAYMPLEHKGALRSVMPVPRPGTHFVYTHTHTHTRIHTYRRIPTYTHPHAHTRLCVHGVSTMTNTLRTSSHAYRANRPYVS